MTPFKELWNFIKDRSNAATIPVVQDEMELEHIYDLMTKCESYLEIGTAEGNGFYVLVNAMKPGSKATYIDLGEKHTTPHREFILNRLQDYVITQIHGDSNDFKTYECVKDKRFDTVFIDAGHDDFNVAIDAIFYGALAKKYIVFHDIMLPDVRRAFDWYCRQRPKARNYKVINSTSYGYGVIDLNE